MSGNCFAIAFKLVGRSSHYKIIHAIVERRSDRYKHLHAFIYDTSTDTIIDKSNNKNIELSKELYFALGNIEHYVEYDINEVMIHAGRTEHYGPWDDKLVDECDNQNKFESTIDENIN